MIQAINEKLNEYCKANGVIYLDYFSRMVDDRGGLKKEYGPDGVHPNQLGYKIMSEIADKELSRLTKV